MNTRTVVLYGSLLLVAWPAIGSSIHLRTRVMDPLTEQLSLSDGRVPRTAGHLLLQFTEPVRPEMMRELERRGIRVLRRVPDDAVLAVSTGGWMLDGLPLRWAGALPAADKMSPALDGSPARAYLVIFHPDVSSETASALVEEAGLVRLPHPSLLPGHILAAGPEPRVRTLAERDEVAYVLPASADLVAGSRVIACAGPLEDGETVAEYVKVGRGWPALNGEVVLRYVVASITSRLAESTVRTEVARALDEWARHAKLRFTAASDSSADRTVAIRFARGNHGDPYPFDGSGRVLAHTFYPSPPNAEPLAGDIHLDDDEDWSAGSAVDLYSVVLHEAGHALGLGHTDRPGSVMYPYYRVATVLSTDDIAGIQDLYGERSAGEAIPVPPTTPSSPASPATPTSRPAPATPDRTPPSLRVVAPAFTMVTTSANSISFRGTATDSSAVSMVNWSASSGASGKAAGTTEWTVPEVPLLFGNNTVTVRAYDTAGNSTWRAVTVVRR